LGFSQKVHLLRAVFLFAAPFRARHGSRCQYAAIDGEDLTINALRELAKKSNDLKVSDFDECARVEIDPDYHVFDVEGKYTLSVILDANGNTSYNHCRQLNDGLRALG
jgi:hypothetical protein